jgi:hypothetical protein
MFASFGSASSPGLEWQMVASHISRGYKIKTDYFYLMTMVAVFLPDNFTPRRRELCQLSGAYELVGSEPGPTVISFFSQGTPSGSALTFSIGLFFNFLNARQELS